MPNQRLENLALCALAIVSWVVLPVRADLDKDLSSYVYPPLMGRVKRAGVNPTIQACPPGLLGYFQPETLNLVVCYLAVSRGTAQNTFTHEVTHLVQKCATGGEGSELRPIADAIMRSGVPDSWVRQWRDQIAESLSFNLLGAVWASSRGSQLRAEAEMEAYALQSQPEVVALLFDEYCGSGLK